jgi:uncharacterized protein (DUF433 family)
MGGATAASAYSRPHREPAVNLDPRFTTAVHDEPAYRASEAAHILALPLGTVQAWSFGHDYVHADGTAKRFKRVIAPADVRRRLLSFANLCELHLLSVIRRRHRVKLPQVRRAVDFMVERLSEPRPLLSRHFRTNGVDLFVENAGELLNVSQQGQQALRDDFERALSRVDYDSHGVAVRLFPYVAPQHAVQTRDVVVDPLRSFGRPALVGAFVRTEVIADRFDAGDSIDEMAKDYRVNPRQIEQALRFEWHRRRAA